MDTGSEGVVLRFRRGSRDGWKTVCADMATVSTSKITELANAGIHITDVNKKEVIRYLSDMICMNYDDLPRETAFSHLGWDRACENCVPYSCEGELTGEAGGRIMEALTVPRGGFYEWRDAVIPFYKKDHAVHLGVNLALCSLLLPFLPCNGSGLHFFGPTDTGKTVLLRVLASLYGDPSVLLSNFSDTRVAMERMAAFNGCVPMFIDELELCHTDGKENVDSLIYELTEGQGRNRGRKEGGISHAGQWKLYTFTSGETPIITDSSMGGASNRIAECGIEKPLGTHSELSALCEAVTENYGFAAMMFFNAVFGTSGKPAESETLASVRKAYREFSKQLAEDGVSGKQAAPFAAALSVEKTVAEQIFGIREQTAALKKCCAKMSKRDGEIDQNARAYAYLRDRLMSKRNCFLTRGENADGKRTEIYGVIRTEEHVADSGETETSESYYVIPSVYSDIVSAGGFNPKTLLRWMKDNGKTECNHGNLYKTRLVQLSQGTMGYVKITQ